MKAFKSVFTRLYSWNRFDYHMKEYKKISRNFYLFSKYLVQYFRKGFSEPDIFDLNDTLYDFIYPRLKHFHYNLVNDNYHGHPCNLKGMEEWTEIVEKMLRSFYLLKELDIDWNAPYHFGIEEERARQKEIYEGLKLFAEYLPSLWD